MSDGLTEYYQDEAQEWAEQEREDQMREEIEAHYHIEGHYHNDRVV